MTEEQKTPENGQTDEDNAPTEEEATETESKEAEDADEPEQESAEAESRDAPPAFPSVDPAETMTTAPAPKKKGGCFSTMVGLVIIAAVGVGGGYATRDQWEPHVPFKLPEIPEVGDLSLSLDFMKDSRVDELTQRLKTLEERASANAAKDAALADLTAERDRLAAELAQALERMGKVEGDLDALRATIDAATKSGDGTEPLSKIAERLSEIERGAAEIKALAPRIAELEKSVSDVAASAGSGSGDADALSGEMQTLTQRLEALEKGGAHLAMSTAGARSKMLAIGNLRNALGGPGPFAKELGALEALAATDPSLSETIENIRPYATSGAPTLARLGIDFDAMAADVARAARAARGEGVMGEALSQVTSLVSIRRTDGAGDADPVDAALAKAEKAIKAGALEPAVQALDILGGKPAEAAAAWLNGARSRLVAEQARAMLHVYAMSLLAAPSE